MTDKTIGNPRITAGPISSLDVDVDKYSHGGLIRVRPHISPTNELHLVICEQNATSSWKTGKTIKSDSHRVGRGDGEFQIPLEEEVLSALTRYLRENKSYLAHAGLGSNDTVFGDYYTPRKDQE